MLGHDINDLLEQLSVVGLVLVASIDLNAKLNSIGLLERFQNLGYLWVGNVATPLASRRESFPCIEINVCGTVLSFNKRWKLTLTFVGAGDNVKSVGSEQHQSLRKLVSKEPSLPVEEKSQHGHRKCANSCIFHMLCAYLHGGGLLIDVVIV